MKKNDRIKSRRAFIQQMGLAGLSFSFLPVYSNYDNISTSEKMKMKNNNEDKLGIALVGLGTYSSEQLAPALLQTSHCYLASIVTGTPSKIQLWKEKYNIPDTNIYNYQNFDSIKDNPDIDIVYVVLPNSMHAEFCIRAAQAGKHVICEKPMATSVADCDRMIAACKQAGKTLSIGYRLHFDPYHLEMIRLAKEKKYGTLNKMSAGFGFNAEKGIWRLDKRLAGGGPLMDLGIYCLQAVCYTSGYKPIAVTAQSAPITDHEKFIDIEETLTWQMEMPDGLIAECKTSYTTNSNFLRVDASQGWFELKPAFNYAGLKGNTSDGKQILFPKLSQQQLQLDGIAQSIKTKQPIIVPGEMGKRDLQIITAIYEAMRTGKRVEVNYAD